MKKPTAVLGAVVMVSAFATAGMAGFSQARSPSGVRACAVARTGVSAYRGPQRLAARRVDRGRRCGSARGPERRRVRPRSAARWDRRHAPARHDEGRRRDRVRARSRRCRCGRGRDGERHGATVRGRRRGHPPGALRRRRPRLGGRERSPSRRERRVARPRRPRAGSGRAGILAAVPRLRVDRCGRRLRAVAPGPGGRIPEQPVALLAARGHVDEVDAFHGGRRPVVRRADTGRAARRCDRVRPGHRTGFGRHAADVPALAAHHRRRAPGPGTPGREVPRRVRGGLARVEPARRLDGRMAPGGRVRRRVAPRRRVRRGDGRSAGPGRPGSAPGGPVRTAARAGDSLAVGRAISGLERERHHRR